MSHVHLINRQQLQRCRFHAVSNTTCSIRPTAPSRGIHASVPMYQFQSRTAAASTKLIVIKHYSTRVRSTASEGVGQLAETDLPEWQSCLDQLKELGIEGDKAHRVLRKAFGWDSQGYWRNQKVKVVPEPSQVSSVLHFLQELGINGADLAKVVTKFPEVLGCSLDTQLQRNVARLQDEWKLKGTVLANAIKRQPEVLGYYYDCGGDCVGECNRCWVRF